MSIAPRLAALVPQVLLASACLAVADARAAQSHPCAKVPDPDERLACYDQAFPPVPEARSGVEERRRQAVEDFGLNQRQVSDRRPEGQGDVEPDRIEATVARVTERASGERMVALENGQTWLLTEVTSRGRLKPGDKVTIRAAALGTFMLLTPKRVPLRARRVN